MAVPSIQTAQWYFGNATTVDMAPSGTPIAGELLVAIIATNDSLGPVNSPPSGWTTLVVSNGAGIAEAAVYYKVSVGGETTQTFTVADTAKPFVSGYLRIADVNNDSPVNGTNTNGSGPFTAHSFPTVTTTKANCLGLYILSIRRDTTLPFSVSGTGWSEYDAIGIGGLSGVGMSFGTKSITSAGSSGSLTVTSSVSEYASRTVIALAPLSDVKFLGIESFTSINEVSEYSSINGVAP